MFWLPIHSSRKVMWRIRFQVGGLTPFLADIFIQVQMLLFPWVLPFASISRDVDKANQKGQKKASSAAAGLGSVKCDACPFERVINSKIKESPLHSGWLPLFLSAIRMPCIYIHSDVTFLLPVHLAWLSPPHSCIWVLLNGNVKISLTCQVRCAYHCSDRRVGRNPDASFLSPPFFPQSYSHTMGKISRLCSHHKDKARERGRGRESFPVL